VEAVGGAGASVDQGALVRDPGAAVDDVEDADEARVEA
jgi:hypothetical protein